MRVQTVKNIEKDFLEPSFRYLVKNGLENTSVRDLCKELGVSYGSLYYWFEGKEDIFTSVVNYGIGKVADSMFKMVFERLDNTDLFFKTFVDEIDMHLPEFKLVYQFATSPDYGAVVRKKSEDFNVAYELYINQISQRLSIPAEKVAPVIYLLISILSDYIVWEDRKSTDMQMQFLHNMVKSYVVTA